MRTFDHAFSALGLAVAVVACGAGAAHAHGTIPATNTVSFGPGQGGALFGTNFGALWQTSPDGPLNFVCETLVSGEPRSLDAWVWLGSGRIVAAATTGGFAFGVYGASDASGCAFALIPGTEDLTVSALVADPDDASAFFAAGRNDPTSGEHSGRLVHGTPDALDVLYDRAGYLVTGVRARGGHIYATVASQTVVGETMLVHSADAGAHWDEWPQTLAAGETLVPLGVAATEPLTMWLVHGADTGDTLLRTTDGGAHLAPVLTVDARLTAFATSDDGVRVWVQSPTRSVYRSLDGGATFTPLAGSPHGSCLAFHAGELVACGVPWQDGMAWGVSSDGATFTARVASFDDIAAALACPDRPAASETCQNELVFLRGYYGFAAPPAPDGAPEASEAAPESGPEASAESAPEASAEASADDATDASAERTGAEPAARAAQSGCAGGSAWTTGALGAALALSARRRPRTRR